MYDLKMSLGTKSCLNKYKVHTVVDGNHLPIGVYKHLGGNVYKLAKTIDRSIRLVWTLKIWSCYITVQFKIKR